MPPLLGLDCLGLARFSKEAMDAFPTNYALGVFSRTFGDAMPNTQYVVNQRKVPVLRVQLMWSNNDHTYSEKDTEVMKAEARRWNSFAKSHKTVKVYLSPFCEHKLQNIDHYLDIVKKEAPDCTPVNSNYRGSFSTKYHDEVHGFTPQPPGGKYLFSFDGSDMLEGDIEVYKSRHKTAEIWFGWTANFNGNMEVSYDPNAPKIPIPDRKAWPSAKLMKACKYVMETTRGMANLPANWLWKAYAEDKGNGDPRQNKPVLICPVKAGSAELLNAGRVVSTALYYGTFKDGRFRYYFPEWGFEIAQKNGNALLDVRVGGKIYGKVQPAFRHGEFRAK